MNTTISNNGLPKFTPATSNSASGTATTGGASAAPSPRTDDQLKLTDSALALQQAARPNEATAIDPKRVEQVRKALADGSYKIDASRIADRMLALEQQLAGTGKA